MRKHIYLIILVVFFSSCSNKYQSITTSKNLANDKSLDKIVIIEPYFVYKDFTDKNVYKYFKSSDKDEEYRKILKKEAKKLKVNIETYDKNNLKGDETFYFNDLIPLKNEIMINLSKLDIDSKEDKKSKTQQYKDEPVIDPKYSKLMDELGSKYFATTGIVSLKDKPRINWAMIAIPPIMLHTFQPYKESIYYFVLANVESGEIVYQEVRYHNEKMTKTNMSIYTYDTLKKIKKTIKKGK